MPIYEYRCEACSHQLEALQKLSDAPLEICPQCKEPKLRKQISAVAFRLKGGGWYETDFKSAGKKNLAGDGGDKPAGDSGKAEAKPAASSGGDSGGGSSAASSTTSAPASPASSSTKTSSD